MLGLGDFYLCRQRKSAPKAQGQKTQALFLLPLRCIAKSKGYFYSNNLCFCCCWCLCTCCTARWARDQRGYSQQGLRLAAEGKRNKNPMRHLCFLLLLCFWLQLQLLLLLAGLIRPACCLLLAVQQAASRALCPAAAAAGKRQPLLLAMHLCF